jgi:spore coat protein U-like protein
MKKITLLIMFAISAISFAQTSADGIADVNAVIVKPIGITVADALDFGSFTTPETGTSTVTLAATGLDRDFSTTDMEIASMTSFGVPTFTVDAAGSTYGITLNVTQAPKETGGSTMTLNDLTHNLPSDGSNNATSFKIGGKLSVPSTQAVGTYTGKVTVTVTYE